MAAKRSKLEEPEPWQSLEFFPTPPWATRALTHNVLMPMPEGWSCWEPCAGLGHMSDVLRESFDFVRASDVYLYPLASGGDAGRLEVDRFDFLDPVAVADAPEVEWIITNPPFSKAAQMLDHALIRAQKGVAFLLRMQWLEGETRYRGVFEDRGPSFIAPFVERVPMCEGGYDLEGSSATMYAWFVWERFNGAWAFGDPDHLHVRLIPPCRLSLWRPEDRDYGRRHVPGWIPPSKLKKAGRAQAELFA